MEGVFKKADISEGVNVDGENLTNLMFADDVALFNETTKQMEKKPKQSKLGKPESWLKNTQRKEKVHDKPCGQRKYTNRSAKKIEKVTEFKYLGQTTHLKDTTKKEIYARIRAAWSCFGKNKEILQDKQLPISLKKTSNGPMYLANHDLWLPNTHKANILYHRT